MNKILVEISIGELLDKISILENTNYKKIYKFWIDEIKNKNLLN